MNTRVRKVWPRQQVAHIWANRSQDEAREPSGNFYFTGPSIFSYGSHFLIAHFIDMGDGRTILLENASGYSSTTSKHKWAVSSALTRAQREGAISIAGLKRDDVSSWNWAAELAQKASEQAAHFFREAAESKRKSGKRNMLLHCAAQRVNAAYVLAKLAVSGKGDASATTKPGKAKARTVLAAIDKLPLFAFNDEQTNDEQKTIAASNAKVLDMPRIRSEVERKFRQVEQDRESALYNRECGRHDSAMQYATQGLSRAAELVSLVKQYKLRMPGKLPAFGPLIAELQPAYDVFMREASMKSFRRELALAEDNMAKQRRRRRISWEWVQDKKATRGSMYSARTHAERALNHLRDLRHDLDGLPQAWINRARDIQDRAQRALDWEQAADWMKDARNAALSAAAMADNGEYRTAANTMRVSIKDAQRALAVAERMPSLRRILGDANVADWEASAARWSESFADEDRARMAAWRANQPGATLPYPLDDTLLRIKGETIETSRGAIVPLAVAPNLWRVIRIARAGKLDLSQVKGMRVGHFTLDDVAADGSLNIGCHCLAYSELQLIAQQLGYDGASL